MKLGRVYGDEVLKVFKVLIRRSLERSANCPEA